MSKLDFLEKYAVEGRHYDVGKEIDKALDSSNILSKVLSIEHPKATSKNITKALDDPDYNVRLSAIKNPNATVEHISKALDDPERDVRYFAMHHPKATKNILLKPLKMIIGSSEKKLRENLITTMLETHQNGSGQL